MMITLSDTLTLASIAGIDARGASDGELLTLWRRRHVRPALHPYPVGRILAIAWVGDRDDLHLRFLRPRCVTSQIRLTGAVLTLTLELMRTLPQSRQQRRALQLVAIDRLGATVALVQQSPGVPRILGACRSPLVAGSSVAP